MTEPMIAAIRGRTKSTFKAVYNITKMHDYNHVCNMTNSMPTIIHNIKKSMITAIRNMTKSMWISIMV